MGKPKKPRDEILTQKRLAAQKRQELIRNDPVLYQQQKYNNRKRYLKRKQDFFLLIISEMTEKERKKARKRNRENFRAYYKRKKEKRLDTFEDEVIVDVDIVDEPEDSVRDPLNIVLLKNTTYLVRSKNAEECPDKSIISTNVIENTTIQSVKSETNLTDNTSSSSDALVSLTLPVSYTRLVGADTISKPEESTCLENEDTFNNDTGQNSSSRETPILYASISSRKNNKKRMNSSSLVFRRYKHKVSKEMTIMRKKIADSEREKEKYRKQALRSKRLIYVIKKEINQHFLPGNL